ncbi:hypothetical protein Ancab_031476 [Ancistrocladus abbreviatus]
MVVKDEVIVDLADPCRANQKKLMQMLTVTMDEELLAMGLELHDAMQSVLAKHDAIDSGTPFITYRTTHKSQADESLDHNLEPSEPRYNSSPPNAKGSLSKADGKMQTIEPSSAAPLERHQVDEEEKDDEFAQIARRHPKPHPNTPMGAGEDIASSNNASSDSVPSNALVFPDILAPVKTTKEQDMIGLLSIVLSKSLTSPQEPQTSETAPPKRQKPVTVSSRIHGLLRVTMGIMCMYLRTVMLFPGLNNCFSLSPKPNSRHNLSFRLSNCKFSLVILNILLGFLHHGQQLPVMATTKI